MELFVAFAIVVAIVAALQTRDVAERARNAEERLRLLESDVFKLQVALDRGGQRAPASGEAPAGRTPAEVSPVGPAATASSSPSAPRAVPPIPQDAWAERWREAHPGRETVAATPAGSPAPPSTAAAEPSHVAAGLAVPDDYADVAQRRRIRATRERIQEGRLRPAAAAAENAQDTERRAPDDRPSVVTTALARLGLVVPSEGGERLSRAGLEAWLEGRLLAVVGGIALTLGAVFFLSLAFSRGWITEEMRVLIGLAGGAGLLVLGELAFTRVHGIVGHVLVAVGLAIVSLALLAATRLYGLVPVEWGLLGALVAAVAAALIAVRHDSQVVAAFGLIAVLASPPALGASPTVVTLLFVAVALVGTTGIALFRTWAWLPPLAFILAGPQVASYVLGGPPILDGLVAAGGFWLVNLVAAGGEEARHRSERLRTSTVTLLLADAAFTLWAGFVILDGSLETWRGTFLFALAALHLALALGFLVRFGDRHPFGLVVAATGVATLTMAPAVQFGGPPVAIAWAAEAVALTWVAVLRRHPYSGGVAILLGIAALAHLVTFEYPPASIAEGFARNVPFAGAEGITFAFMVAALVVAGLIVRIAWIRATLAVVGGIVALWVLPFELSGPALVAGWAALAVAGSVLYVRVVAPELAAMTPEDGIAALALPGWLTPPVSAVIQQVRRLVRPAWVATVLVAWGGAYGHVAAVDYPIGRIGLTLAPEIPFVGQAGLSFAIVVAAGVLAGVLIRTAWIRMWLGALGVLLALYVMPFELSDELLVWAWAVVVGGAWVVEARLVDPRLPAHLGGPAFVRHARPALRTVAALGMVLIALDVLVLQFFLPWGFHTPLSPIPYAGTEGVALLGAVAALGARAWAYRDRWVRVGAAGIALTLVASTVGMEVRQPHVTIAWGLLAIGSVLLARRIAGVDALARPSRPIAPWASVRLPLLAATIAIVAIVSRTLNLAGPAAFGQAIAGASLHGTPFLDERTYVILVLAATLVGVGWAWAGLRPLLRGGVCAALVVAWLLPFEVRMGYAVAGWAALGLAAAWLARVVPAERDLLGGTAIGLGAAGLVAAFAFVAPPERLVVDASTIVPGMGVLTDAAVGLGALALAIALGALVHRSERLAMPALAIAGIVAVYMLSVGVVDAFQSQLATRPVDDLEGLQKSAQVGLSVLWSVLGGIGFAVGLRLHRTPVRLFGLALLGLATVKVFLVDLAALDLAYRVLSLVALGVLLLISALVYARMQHPHGPVTPTHV